MKKMLTVLKFELKNYFGSKSYVISTILVCLLCVGIMFVPRIVQAFKDSGKEEGQVEEIDEDDMSKYAIYDSEGICDRELLGEYFGNVIFVDCESREALIKMVENDEAEGGFAVNSLTSFDYYVFNKGMFDSDMEIFTEYMSMLVKMDYFEQNNLDAEEFFALEYTPIEVNENILGKDGTTNYWYCYVLIMIVYMVVIMYGTTIATGVANEKGNRSIEVMVTSTSSTSLLFGKVFAGAIATVFQVGLIAGGLLGSYQFNKEYWNMDISAFFDVPAEVLVTFAIFGIGGFLFYAFMYGALGALVSKIEDLNKSSGTAQMLVVIVFIVVLLQLTNADGIVMKVCSFLPISSYSAMFVRVSMGTVAMWEIVLSAVILYASVIGMGILGGKIFRNSTLRYGNPIKLSSALKSLKQEKE